MRGRSTVIVLDEEKLNLILTEMAEGLVRSPLEIALFAALVVGIILTALILYRRQLRKARDHNLRRSQRIFARGVRERGLGCGEVTLLESMTSCLKDPSQKHVLLENQAVFNTCAQKLLHGGLAGGAEIAALRLKLNFGNRSPEQVFNSSAQLYVGLPVILAVREKVLGRGLVRAVEPHSLRIALKDNSAGEEVPSLIHNNTVQVVFQIPSGRFVFFTRVKKEGRGILEIAHSEEIRRLQRRAFYRKHIALPVFVKRVGSGQKTTSTTLYELGGGGASLSNREALFAVGDRASLFFAPSRQNGIRVTAEIVRLSKRGTVAHVRFYGISEPERDRIMGLLFKTQENH